ncbi:hypothetical protein [Corynebacterium sp. HMSC08F01]|uniref:hypothetical protein n=1 Tax=Corynebacterium sp. HMSC08F01 TaxID=1581139 RepID=UPI00114CBD50|nr:hypothetical protein [Corynebacterium sp. HMSC08F01]
MDTKEWAEDFTAQIGVGIERSRRGRSDQWIADRTAELGHPISRPAISEYRRGKRKYMPVTDWLVIAAALEVPPISLLFPGLPDKPVSLLPDRGPVVAFDAVEWISGERINAPNGEEPLFGLEGPDVTHSILVAEYMQRPEPIEASAPVEVQILRKTRTIAEVALWARQERERLSPAIQDGDKEALRDAMTRVEAFEQLIREIRAEVEELGGVVRDHGHPKQIKEAEEDAGR